MSAFVAPDDLQGNLAIIETETAALGLTMTAELHATLPGGQGPVVARGYEGVDAAGRATHAVRIATSQGIIMAVGPRDSGDHATELVVSLVPGASGNASDGAFRSLTDLNGDGSIDVVLRGRARALEVHRLFANGSAQYEVQMSLRPVDVIDCNDDGYPDLVGRDAVLEGDPIAPVFVDVATFEHDRYRASTDAAVAFHTLRARQLEKESRTSASNRQTENLRLDLEQAWHTILAGSSRSVVLTNLGNLAVPADLQGSFARHLARLSKLDASRPTSPDKPDSKSAHEGLP